MKTRRFTQQGFTLAEILVAVALASVVVAGTTSLFITFLRSYNNTTLMRNTATQASMGLERMVYGVGTNGGLRAAEWALEAGDAAAAAQALAELPQGAARRGHSGSFRNRGRCSYGLLTCLLYTSP
ncbi:MAG: prepilin-type N-terminal cleavage/methylation domain-containing protein, partial [Verrucomicrobiae bacterium]|nr:prepilin-type N-terminal cleavage/methylation domain-containing protein [Verrucomicrobiae bacterium]